MMERKNRGLAATVLVGVLCACLQTPAPVSTVLEEESTQVVTPLGEMVDVVVLENHPRDVKQSPTKEQVLTGTDGVQITLQCWATSTEAPIALARYRLVLDQNPEEREVKAHLDAGYIHIETTRFLETRTRATKDDGKTPASHTRRKETTKYARKVSPECGTKEVCWEDVKVNCDPESTCPDTRRERVPCPSTP
jgi:hypothetical protein